MLRERVDDATYDSEQLLLSTLLLTVLVFLFPTVFVYYLLFGSVCPSSLFFLPECDDCWDDTSKALRLTAQQKWIQISMVIGGISRSAQFVLHRVENAI